MISYTLGIFLALVLLRNDVFIFSEKGMLWRSDDDLLHALDGAHSDGAKHLPLQTES